MTLSLEKTLRQSLTPTLTILVSVLICAVPWGVRASIAFVLPLATAMLIFLYAVRPNVLLPPWLAFLVGILTDLLTGGPLGYWALLFVIAHGIGRSLPFEDNRRFLRLWPSYLLAAIVIGSFAWIVGSAYYMRLIDWRPLAIALVAVSLVFPLLLRIAGFRRKLGVWTDG